MISLAWRNPFHRENWNQTEEVHDITARNKVRKESEALRLDEAQRLQRQCDWR